MRVNTGPGGVDARPTVDAANVHRAGALLFNFDIDDATVKPAHTQWLDDNVVPFLATATRISLVGTASRTGTDQYNLALSQRRVQAVKDYLLSKGARAGIFSELATGEQAAALAGERNNTEDPRFRAVDVALEAGAAALVIRVRVHPLDINTRAVRSILGANGKEHFVAAKNPTGVTLQAVVATGTAPANVTWEARDEANALIPVISPAAGNDPLTVRLPSHISRKLRVRLLAGGSVLWEGFVWLVFANVAATPANDLIASDARSLTIGLAFNFQHTITPPSIISTTADVPNFTGPKTTALPGGTNYAGKNLEGGADHKWDSSRQIRAKFLNPANIPLASIGGDASFNTTFLNYPSTADGDGHPGNLGAVTADQLAIIGNDDAGTGDEDNDPYTDPDKGKLIGFDRPTRGIDHSVGADGNTLEWRLHFFEFARLEISGKWFRISDPFFWRVHIKMRRAAGVWVNDGSIKELNNNGF